MSSLKVRVYASGYSESGEKRGAVGAILWRSETYAITTEQLRLYDELTRAGFPHLHFSQLAPIGEFIGTRDDF